MLKMTAAELTKSFIESNPKHHTYSREERLWIRGVFKAFTKCLEAHRTFTMDEVWAELDHMTKKGTLREVGIDHRILGPMLKHLDALGFVESTGYFKKATRSGGGSRPVTIWRSRLKRTMALAA